MVDFEDVHKDLIYEIPNPPAHVLDIGAGSGRDAAWFAKRGYNVTAVEPATKLRDLASKLHPNERITWLNDSLPSLSRLRTSNKQFDFILLSAVWMHLAPGERAESLASINELLSNQGKIAITLRIGPEIPSRLIFAVGLDELAELSKKLGLTFKLLSKTPDLFGRQSIYWITVILGRNR